MRSMPAPAMWARCRQLPAAPGGAATAVDTPAGKPWRQALGSRLPARGRQGSRPSGDQLRAAPRLRCAAAAPGPASERQRQPHLQEGSSNVVPKPIPCAAQSEFNWQAQWYPLVSGQSHARDAVKVSPVLLLQALPQLSALSAAAS